MANNLPVRWTRDQMVIACGLYFTLPFGKMHKGNPAIMEIARLMGRTPSSLAMKLVNFASLDPVHKSRGVRGLSGHSKADELVWAEFQDNWDQMTILSERSLGALRAGGLEPSAVVEPAPQDYSDGRTEVERTVVVRTMQGVFRKMVLAAYNSTCCITGNPVPELLVASHILPWGEFPEERLNPRNGLCLAAHFDRAFDRGLISVDQRRCLLLSPALKRFLVNDAVKAEFGGREGRPIACPERFEAADEFLAYHRSVIFGRRVGA